MNYYYYFYLYNLNYFYILISISLLLKFYSTDYCIILTVIRSFFLLSYYLPVSYIIRISVFFFKFFKLEFRIICRPYIYISTFSFIYINFEDNGRQTTNCIGRARILLLVICFWDLDLILCILSCHKFK